MDAVKHKLLIVIKDNKFYRLLSIGDIQRALLKKMDLSQLPQSLSDIAYLRMEYPDASLKELGQLLEPPVGKSGVNHRLRKLADIADSLREGMG